jgi:hypothetical protein
MAAKSGNVLGAIGGLAGLGGLSDVANAANFAGAVKSGNPLAILSSGAGLGGTDLSGLANSAGLNELNNIGGYNVNDVAKAYQTAKALKSGDPTSIISSLGGYAGGVGQPSDSYTPFPTDPSDTFSSIQEPLPRNIATKPIESSIGEVSQEIPSINANPYEMPQLPSLPSVPSGLTPFSPSGPTDYSGSSFNDAFARARANGDQTFIWNGKPYNTQLAPNPSTPPNDSVGGGRGGQGGMTAQQSNSSYAPAPSTNPLASFVNSLIPSAQAGALPTSKPQDLASQIPGQKYAAPPSTYDQNNSIFGRVADELGLPQEFQRNFSNTLNALPGVNLPFGAVGKFAGAADELGAIGNEGKYAEQASRFTPQSPVWESVLKDMRQDVTTKYNFDTQKLLEKAIDAVNRGDPAESYRIIENSPKLRQLMLDFSKNIGFQWECN